MRYAAEHRGYDFPDEWAVFDITLGWSGFVVACGMTEEMAFRVAGLLNEGESKE